MYKDGMMEDRMYDGDMMKRGGRKRRAKKAATHQQIVNVKVKVGDTVQLQKGRAPEKPMIGQFRLLQGVGDKYANAPAVKQASSFGIAPSSLSPMYNDPVVVGGGSEYNKNKMDDVRQDTNPWDLHPSLNQSMRATPGKDMFADRRVNYDTVQRTPFQSQQPDKLQVPDQSPSMRGMPSQPSAGFMRWLESMETEPAMAAGPAMPAGSEMMAESESGPSEEDPLRRFGASSPGEKYSLLKLPGYDYTNVPYKVGRDGKRYYLVGVATKSAMRHGGSVF